MAITTVFHGDSFAHRRSSTGECRTPTVLDADATSRGFTIEWMLRLNDVCQVFAGQTARVDPDQLRRAFRQFATDLPEPTSQFERLFLHDRVVLCVDRAGRQFHTDFHGLLQPSRCERLPTDGLGSMWPVDSDARQGVRTWVDKYLAAFERDHVWPLALRAASSISARLAQPIDVVRLAKGLGCSRSVLTRSFEAMFGVTMSSYQRRMRLRAGVVALREQHSKVSATAKLVGYRSPKNFYRALDLEAGLTPTAVRLLTPPEVDRLLVTRLREPVPARAAQTTLRLSAAVRR
jgi:AraC-like DNA-binding protein